MVLVIPAAIYFLLSFAAGFVLGVAREFLLVPRFGSTVAVMIEAPAMLLACIAAARWTVGRFMVPPAAGPRLQMGAIAFGLLIVAEVAGSMALRGMTLSDYVGQYRSAEGWISLAMFLIYALLPMAVHRAR